MRVARRKLGILGLGCIVACTDDAAPVAPEINDPPPAVPPVVAAVIVAPLRPTIAVGQSLQLRALVIDARGALLTDRPVQWENPFPGALTVSTSGLVTAHTAHDPTTWFVPAVVTATAEGISGSASVMVTEILLAPVQVLLNSLPIIIQSALGRIQNSMALNPQLFAYYQLKIEMLQQPGLEAEIVEGQHHESGAVSSIDGHTLPIGAVFPADTMREGAIESIRVIEAAVAALEDFLAIPFPTSDIRMQYGFVLGGAGGTGSLYVEDRGTYHVRPPGTQLEYDAMIAHEVGHSFYGNEALTQFLELLVHNRRLGSSDELSTWTFTRGWVPARESNQGVHALLDIYQMIGAEGMARAYRAIYPMRPRYGSPLTVEAQQVFVRNAPPHFGAAVAEKAARIGG